MSLYFVPVKTFPFLFASSSFGRFLAEFFQRLNISIEFNHNSHLDELDLANSFMSVWSLLQIMLG